MSPSLGVLRQESRFGPKPLWLPHAARLVAERTTTRRAVPRQTPGSCDGNAAALQSVSSLSRRRRHTSRHTDASPMKREGGARWSQLRLAPAGAQRANRDRR
eukprot:7390959-Prymnesium_polylepis.2